MLGEQNLSSTTKTRFCSIFRDRKKSRPTEVIDRFVKYVGIEEGLLPWIEKQQ